MDVDTLKPVLFRYTVADLWMMAHTVAFLGWAMILIAPFWRPALTWAYLPPIIQAVLYASILLPKMAFPDDPNKPPPDFNNMLSIKELFADTDIFFCGWIHYLAFDQLLGLAVAYDALTTVQVSKFVFYTVVTPCLFLTFYLGPVGFLSYMLVRRFFLVGNDNGFPPVKLDKES